VARVTVGREKRLNYFFECDIGLGGYLSLSIGTLRWAVKHKESDGSEPAQKDQRLPEILQRHGFLQFVLARKSLKLIEIMPVLVKSCYKSRLACDKIIYHVRTQASE
jgi:hypothetical protein